ncbi:MAG: DNA cytosine methyltransferase [Thermofilaceae archaeon]
MASLRAASLFSGAGGLDWGFRELGFDIVFASDVRGSAAETYARNFGLRVEECSGRDAVEARRGVVLLCDVARVDFSQLEGVDAVVGGPPCQDFSLVRGPRRRGIEAERGRLYAHFARALAQIQPRIFVFENVPGLKSSNGGLALAAVLRGFESLDESGRAQGYEIVFSDVVDFSGLGVPQRRERLIVIGVRKDLVRGNSELARLRKLAGRLRGLGLLRRYPLTPIEVFEGRVLPDLQGEYREVMRKWEGVWLEAGTPRAWEWKREVWDRLAFDAVEDYLAANGVGQAEESELEEAWRRHRAVLEELGYYGRRVCEDPPADSTCLPPLNRESVVERLKRIPPGENHEFVRGTQWQVEGRGISLVYGRIHPLKPSPTVVAHGGGGTHGYHYDRDRAALSLRERARLQTFPDSFLFSGRRAEVRAQIGEAVPPLASKRIAEAAAELIRSTY